MLLLFRFLRVALLGIIGRRRSVLDESVLRFRVLPHDIDLNMHLNDGRYVSFMGIGRTDLIARTGLLRHLFKMRWTPVVGGLMIRYRREIKPFEKFTLRTRIIGWDEKWFYLEQTFESGGKPRAIAYVRGAIRGATGAVPTSSALRLVGWSEPSPALTRVLSDWPELDI